MHWTIDWCGLYPGRHQQGIEAVFIQTNASWRPFQRVSHPREIVRQFTPNWFTLTMGTGILFLMLAQFPLAIPGLVSLTRVLFWGDGALYLIFALLFAARWI